MVPVSSYILDDKILQLKMNFVIMDWVVLKDIDKPLKSSTSQTI